MAHALHLIQIISSILLVALILIQRTQGDAGASFGGNNTSFAKTRRGAERFIFLLTVVTAIVFVGASLAALFIA